MHRPLAALALLAAALPFAASAQDSGLDYNYVQGGYVATRADGDLDGWGIDGSVAVHPNWHLFAGYTQQEPDDSAGDAKLKNTRLGVGYNHPVGASTDLLAKVAYEKYDIDFDGPGGGDTDGYSAEVGARSAFTDNFEGYALAGYEDGDRYDGDFYGRVGAQVKFSPNWGVGGDVKFADGDTQWFVGPRYSW